LLLGIACTLIYACRFICRLQYSASDDDAVAEENDLGISKSFELKSAGAATPNRATVDPVGVFVSARFAPDCAAGSATLCSVAQYLTSGGTTV
jgi:hypothetical protein